MKTYIFAIHDLFQCENRLHVVVADNEVEALKSAYINRNEKEEDKLVAIDYWQNHRKGNTYSEICNDLIDQELVVSQPISI